ncbi:MAG: MmcQ/YjbR family DNA-binding protein [Parvularculaceae bacterium]
MARDQLARVRKIALSFPGVEEGTSYGTAAFRVRKKFLVRMKEDGVTLVLKTAGLDDKEFLIETRPEIYFETAHYNGWPAVLVRLATISDAELKDQFETAWRREAGKKLLAARDEGA